MFEIAIRRSIGDYRTMLTIPLGKNIYVLYTFQRKSKQVVATPKRDLELIKHRSREAKELANDER